MKPSQEDSAGAASKRRGYCPGVYTPMTSGDGLIVRLRASVRPLTSAQVRALAALATEHGNGLLELTRRANLQLRGVRGSALEVLQRELVCLGLADASPEREKRLSPLMVSPSAELARAGTPLEQLALRIEAMLGADTTPLDLPSKFGLVLDDEAGLLARVPADLRLTVRQADGLIDLSVACDKVDALWLSACTPELAPELVGRLLWALSRAQAGGSMRMRDLLKERGIEALRALVAPGSSAAAEQLPAARAREPAQLIGLHTGPLPWLGLALPFGVGDARTWQALARLAEQFGRGELRVTAARSVLIAGVRVGASDRAALEQAAAEHALIIDPSDRRLHVAACAGAPACGSGLGETRALATTLAASLPALGSGFRMHVSGCDKGCAESGVADVTLLHAEGGVQLGFGCDVAKTRSLPVIALETARQCLTALGRDSRVRPPMTRHYDYERDGAAIYRRSFSIIRSEAQLSRFAPIEERVAVRLIHTSGMVDLADDVLFSPGFADAASAAIRRGAPILCDANMIVSGVTRSRLSAHNDVLCFLDDPRVAQLAKEQATTRSAAALTLWGERLRGAVVAIGNAPTALFRLLELFDETDLRPAAVIGLPVGFVGAAESKQALLADGRVPAMIVRGRRGGSAMTVAAINALASDKE
ncbi:MAG: hypothetical protein JWN48_3565 [Myxococcaceae bacterium]|nr:hypothetical protein [Myxococcaceae bacterium]